MPTIAVFLKLDSERLAECLREAVAKLDDSGGETVLDFSSVRRIDSTVVRVMQELADAADNKAVKIGLRGVNVEIYKVLKLVRLAPRFSFLT